MPQKNDIALKRKILIDGQELQGLVSCSDLIDEESQVEVPSFNRTVIIKGGVKKFAPLDLVYKVQNDTTTRIVLNDWFYKNEIHDITVIETDATGNELARLLLRDCECTKYNERAYDAGNVEYYGIAATITCSSTPVWL